MTAARSPLVGFVGLGAMGQPMALNLAKAGVPLLVWNRTSAKCELLVKAGASVAKSLDEMFERCSQVIMMLEGPEAIDAVLRRSSGGFGVPLTGRTIINMGTTSPQYSRALSKQIQQAGGTYVEAPVSGSKVPAQNGQLVAMLAGDDQTVASISHLMVPMCHAIFPCGPVPNALNMKLAVNVFLIILVTGLAEAAHFAQGHGLELEQLIDILDAGPMASDVSRVKGQKLLAQDFAIQASISNVLENARLIASSARDAGVVSPLIDVCHALYRETRDAGFANQDMISVIRAFERRTASRPV